MTLRQVRTIKDGDETFEVWSNSDASNWEIRKPEPSPGDPAYSAFGALSMLGQDQDLTSPRTVVQNNSYVNNYNNSNLSVNAKNEALKELESRPGFNNINYGFDRQETEPSSEDTSFGAWRRGEEFKKLREEEASVKQVNPQFYKKFGKVDSIIKKLHLRNLIYPIDADFGNTQDYMQINQFKYRPPNEDIFFGGENKPENASPSSLLGKGVPTAAPYNFKEDFLGLVKLPMPNSLADSNNVSWGADQLNSLTAAVSSAVFGQGQQLSRALRDGIKGFREGTNPFNRIQGLASPIVNQIGDSISQSFSEASNIGQDLVTPGSNLNTLGQAIAGSALLNAFQFGITPETVLARGQGVVPNNNLALLFNSPTLREFTFSWKMTPRSREEAQRVNNIIRFFKQGMAPKKGIDTSTGGASYFLGTPNIFDIVFKTTKDGGNFFFAGDDENNSVLRIKTCACTGAAINYTPDGMWNAYDRGQPVSVTMSLRFAELEPIFDTDYDENVFNYDKGRTDLRPVPIDAVGY